MGDRVDPDNDNTVVRAPEPQQPQLHNEQLRRATDFLLDNVRIANHRTHYDKYRRYAELQTQNMFNQLVSLYSSMYTSQWQHYKRFMESFPPPQQVAPATYAARIYVSTWFHDLYCSIREATRAISALAFNERYSQERISYSTKYDHYLTLLLASIKPTHIKLASEDTLYIPILSDKIDWKNETNPFSITNFTIELDAFYGLIQIMEERKHWRMSDLTTNTTGRPCWLFDWHDKEEVCAWFPREGNFNDSDVALAYILGVACTPKLGPRDIDEWQFHLDGHFPKAADITDLDRVHPRRFYGSYEVKTVEPDSTYTLPNVICDELDKLCSTGTARRKVRKATTTGSSALIIGSGSSSATPGGPSHTEDTQVEIVLPSFPRYRIIDWCYYSRVIVNFEWHTRTGALRMLSMN